MYINFEKVIIHNFLSYGHAEINLKNKDYCLVKGINHNPLDLALSNGSGKSSWSSAICWCLTGETVNGLRSNLKNIFIEEDLCYVTLIFSVDNNKFEITRYLEPKSDLRISVNGVDKSGKGIRESSVVLAEYLPDLTSQLLGSIIILGQGLPCKFTSNTPSGRKEVLEKLSKSDFMIQDIKNKLAKVIDENNKQLRDFEDTLLKLTTEQGVLQHQKETEENNLKTFENPIDFNALITEVESNISEQEKLINANENKIKKDNGDLNTQNQQLNTLLQEKANALQKEQNQFNEFKVQYNNIINNINTNYNNNKNNLYTTYTNNKNNVENKFLNEKLELKNNIKNLNDEITKIKNIKDTCPTCGQKLIGVIKPDTTQKEKTLLELQEQLKQLEATQNGEVLKLTESYNTDLSELTNKYNTETTEYTTKFNGNKKIYEDSLRSIESDFNKDISDTNYSIKKLKENIQLYTEDLKIKQNKLISLKTRLSELQVQRDNYTKELQRIKDTLLSVDNRLKKLDEEILYNNDRKSLVESKLEIDSKINTLIKRDFRGFLLSNIINYIDNKAKEYSSYIFGSDNLQFVLDGNNINISYSDKAFENLSGGEKQKVDLIIQFAIRDMMSEYLQFSSNILILDEIFDNLDSIGCNNVINLISKKLNDIESLFIISHHADELEISYDCEMIVEKDINGISKVI